jgi:hypothetical protein
VYLVTIGSPGASPLAFHGHFHTIARRAGERWLLLVDDDGGTADAADFAATRQ